MFSILAVVQAALSFIPQLLRIPQIGRILRVIDPFAGNDAAAIEELQRQADRRKTERKTRRERNARYVLKASDAMECAELTITNGAVLFTIGKAVIAQVISGLGGEPFPQTADEILLDRIFTCIESKTLSQFGKRKKKTKKYYGRPARGHGRGRK